MSIAGSSHVRVAIYRQGVCTRQLASMRCAVGVINDTHTQTIVGSVALRARIDPGFTGNPRLFVRVEMLDAPHMLALTRDIYMERVRAE